jgi:hypothetical protein
MGLTWITEIISWAVGGAYYYWYITDIVNMLRAVLIFVIFCCKRSVLNILRARLALFLPCAKTMTNGKGGISLSGPTSSLRLTASIKKSTKRPSQDTWQACSSEFLSLSIFCITAMKACKPLCWIRCTSHACYLFKKQCTVWYTQTSLNQLTVHADICGTNRS